MSNKIKKYVEVLILVYIIALFSRGFPSISNIYYLTVPILFLFFLDYFKLISNSVLSKAEVIQQPKATFFFFLSFGIWSLTTALWSSDWQITVTRSLFFLFLLISCFRMGELLNKKKVSKGLILLLVIPNLLIILPNIISFIFNYPAKELFGYKYFGFMGFTNHPNKLGQYILLTFPIAIMGVEVLRRKKKLNIKLVEDEGKHGGMKARMHEKNECMSSWRYGSLAVFNHSIIQSFNLLSFGYLILVVCNLVLLYSSHSRAAIISLGLIFVLYLLFTKSFKKIAIWGSILFSIIAVLYISVNPIRESINTHLLKQETNFLDNRRYLIEASWEAALEGGFFGIGYGISSEKYVSNDYGDFKSEHFTREKTVSILALAEETGIIGLTLFLLGVVLLFFTIWKHRDSRIVLLFGIYILVLQVYAQIESWWIGIGAAPLPVFFIFCGYITAMSSRAKSKESI
ncbi:MAG: O-antigen ligase family protein [Melioribacteraceae bacterium]|nr:O-antigen ligase family protein [Melioribacteraceae bacterium]